MLLGASKINLIINSIPKVIIDGLTIAGNLLPAVGFGLLLDMLFSKKLFVFFFLGFFICSYFNIGITGIAILATCIALIISIFGDKGNNGHHDGKDSSDKKDIDDNNLTEGDIDFE